VTLELSVRAPKSRFSHSICLLETNVTYSQAPIIVVSKGEKASRKRKSFYKNTKKEVKRSKKRGFLWISASLWEREMGFSFIEGSFCKVNDIYDLRLRTISVLYIFYGRFHLFY
jgi:hypothetical protein